MKRRNLFYTLFSVLILLMMSQIAQARELISSGELHVSAIIEPQLTVQVTTNGIVERIYSNANAPTTNIVVYMGDRSLDRRLELSAQTNDQIQAILSNLVIKPGILYDAHDIKQASVILSGKEFPNNHQFIVGYD